MPEQLPSLAPRLSYDAADVDRVINDLLAEMTALRVALAEAERRAEDAERRARLTDADATTLGRAMLLVRQLSDEIIEEARTEAAAITQAAIAEPAPAERPALTQWADSWRHDDVLLAGVPAL